METNRKSFLLAVFSALQKLETPEVLIVVDLEQMVFLSNKENIRNKPLRVNTAFSSQRPSGLSHCAISIASPHAIKQKQELFSEQRSFNTDCGKH